MSPWQVTLDVLSQRVGVNMDMVARPAEAWRGADERRQMRSYVSLKNPADVGISGSSTLQRITPEMDVDVRARMQMRSTIDAFHLTVDLDVQIFYGLSHFSRRWLKSVTRHLL